MHSGARSPRRMWWWWRRFTAPASSRFRGSARRWWHAGPRGRVRRRWRCGSARGSRSGWRRRCRRATWYSPWARGTSRVWDRSCWRAWGRRRDATLAALAVALREVEPAALVPAPRGSGRGLVAVDAAGRPLPFDPARAGLDLPIAASADSGVVGVLALIQSVDPALFQTITGARAFARS